MATATETKFLGVDGTEQLIANVKSAIDGKVDKTSIAQNTGDSETTVMSQKAVTERLDVANLAYGTCPTAAATAAKVVTVSGNDHWELRVGSVVMVYFTYTNTASSVTINVNGTGAYPIWYNNAVYTSTDSQYCGYAKRVIKYMFNGTHWVWIGSSYDANTTYKNVSLGHGYATCSTDESTAAKVGTLSSYALTVGGIVAVKFTNAVSANATLNINGKGAKNMFYRGAKITAGVIKAGDIVTFIYDGTQYQLLSVDRWQDDITQLSSEKVDKDELKDYVKSVNGELPDENGNVKVTAQAEQPSFVDSVEEMTDTSKAYVLKSTGEIWTYQSYEQEASVAPNFTNLFDKSKVLVNHAYSNNSSIVAVPSDTNSLSTGHYVTGPYVYDFTGYDITAPSTVRIKGGVDTKNTYSRIVYYRYTVPTDLTADAARTYKQFNTHIAHTTDADGVLSFPLGVNKDGTAVHGELAYFEAFAFSFKLSGSEITIDDVPDLIITIDEEITYTETPGGTFYEWRSTGMSYNATDYEPRIIALEEDVADLKTRVGSLESGGVSATVTEDAEETIYPDFACENDFTIVGDEFWGSKNESTYTRIVRHKIVDGVLTKLSEIKLSDVVHLNTLDYCPENDCLITGNGANDQNTEGNCFWIIPNASNLPNLTGTLSLADIAIQYDVDIGYKVQAIWGDGNLGQHNLVYLLSNDKEVRRAIIHKNSDGSFANTYTIVGDVFTITGVSGYQGADYYGGYLYFGFGGTNFVLAKVNTKDFTAVVTEYPYCTADGTAIKGVFQGVAVDKDHLWLYPNGITDGNYLVKYTR